MAKKGLRPGTPLPTPYATRSSKPSAPRSSRLRRSLLCASVRPCWAVQKILKLYYAVQIGPCIDPCKCLWLPFLWIVIWSESDLTPCRHKVHSGQKTGVSASAVVNACCSRTHTVADPRLASYNIVYAKSLPVRSSSCMFHKPTQTEPFQSCCLCIRLAILTSI